MTIRHPHGLANTRRTRLGAGWAPSHHVEQVTLDGRVSGSCEVELTDDGRDHQVDVVLGMP